jgi:hypothetical protein
MGQQPGGLVQEGAEQGPVLPTIDEMDLSITCDPSFLRSTSFVIVACLVMMLMRSILTSCLCLSASCSFYSYTPHFPSSFSFLHYAHYTLIIIILQVPWAVSYRPKLPPPVQRSLWVLSATQ